MVAARFTVRPFADADYARHVAIYNASYPHDPHTEAEAREEDADWDAARHGNG